MYKIILSLFIVGSFIVTYADSAVQTDWQEGPGYPGPVPAFGNTFDSDTEAICYLVPGQLFLLDGITEYTVDAPGGGINDICTADFDLDGDMDIAGISYVEEYISWWENTNSLGSFWIEHAVCFEFDTGIEIISADVDSDGDMDIIAASYGGDAIMWFENDNISNTEWPEHIIGENFNGAYSVVIADIDGDGDPDVVGSCIGDDQVAWWKNTDGLGITWEKIIIAVSVDLPASVDADDIDGDGDVDVVGFASLDDLVFWWENADGSGNSWIEHVVDSDLDLLWNICCTDMDSDGFIDIAGAALSDTVYWWRNVNGSGTLWTRHIIDENFDGALCVFSTDMDKDGDQDLAGAAGTSNDVTWWENLDGLGTQWSANMISDSLNSPSSVHCADMDGDGNIDVLASEYWVAEIKWWDLNIFEIDGSLESSILDTQSDPDWGALEWSSETPSETSVSFQVRASDDYNSMGVWSDTLTEPCLLDTVLSDGDSYVQYRVLLHTYNPLNVPSLLDVQISWETLGIECETGHEVLALLPFAPNPLSGSPIIRFSQQEIADVKLSVIDLSGRLIEVISLEGSSPGYHTVQIDEFPAGIYFCRMTSGDFTATQRFVVIK